jgi:hypothetical protein
MTDQPIISRRPPLNPKEAARAAGMTESALNSLCKKGQGPFRYAKGRQVFYPEGPFSHWLKARKGGGNGSSIH